MSKLSHIMMSTFLTLYTEGYCSQDPEESKQEGETLTTDKDQAGMGAGTGIKDVSKEMDNEEQVMGEKYNEDEDEPLKDEQKLKQEEGLEMETEFEGKYHDVEQEAKEPNEKEEEEEEEEEELDKEMGEVDKENNDVVDEKLWDEEDDEREQKEQDNIEQNSDMPESDKPTKQEMVANEDEGVSEKKGAPKEKDADASEEEEKEPSDDDPEENPEQQDYVDNMFDPKSDKQPHGEDEEFELPEDMELDKEEANEGNQQIPEELEIGENKEEEEEEEQVDENNDDMGEDKEEEFPEVESPENAEEPKTDEEENDEKNREGEVMPDTIEEEKEEEPEEDNNYVSNRNENEQQTFGVQDNKGKPTNDIKLTASNETNPDDTAENNDDESKSANNENQKEDTKGSKQEGESLDPEKKDVKKTPEAPNPFRSLGDALKHWKNKLNVEDPKNPESNETKEDKESKEKEKTEDAPTKDNDQNMFEYIQEGEDKTEDNQVLGIASEEQLEKFDTEKIGQYEEEMEDKEEESQLDIEEDNALGDDEKQNKSKASEKPKLGTFKEKPLKEELDEESIEEDIKNLEETLDNPLEKSSLDNQKEIVGPVRALESSIFATDSNNMGLEELIGMRNELTKNMADWYKDEDRVNKGIQIWRYLQRLTGPLSQELCEQLRLILEPTQTSKLKGDYRTGKRLNMRKVIPYIASNFRKDKIWLRRTKPAKREYQILIGIDDSESIAIGGAGELLREAVATITQALVHLDVGQISIVKFGSEFELLHSFTEPFSDQIAAQVFPRLQFKQQKTNMALFLETSVQMLENARNEFNSDGNLLQIMFVMSDGRFGNERKSLQRWLRRSEEQNILVVFLIMDIAKEKESILDIQSLGYLEDGKMTVTPYIDGFPFLYYIILQRISNLPQVLADALRQWFEMMANKE